jgi:hypothetical protein
MDIRRRVSNNQSFEDEAAMDHASRVWHEQVSSAQSASEVLWCTRNYLVTWPRSRLARLPLGCRPSWVDDASEIHAWHRKLVDEQINGTNRLSDVDLEEVVDFFARAAARLTFLDRAARGAHAS